MLTVTAPPSVAAVSESLSHRREDRTCDAFLAGAYQEGVGGDVLHPGVKTWGMSVAVLWGCHRQR